MRRELIGSGMVKDGLINSTEGKECMAEVNLNIDLTPILVNLKQGVRDILVTDIGSLWDDYCYENNVPPEIKLHGIEFLSDFADKITGK